MFHVQSPEGGINNLMLQTLSQVFMK